MTAALDPDRRLVLAYTNAKVRPALEALWRLDVTLGAVLATGRDPRVSEIRLAWWREALERLDRAPPPAEPVLQALAGQVLPAGVSGADLAGMERGWAALLAPGPLDAAALAAYAEGRGGRLFACSARLLGAAEAVAGAGARWALADLARRSARGEEAEAAIRTGRAIAEEGNWPKSLRPLALLSLLTNRDLSAKDLPLETRGSPARVLRVMKYRLTGT